MKTAAPTWPRKVELRNRRPSEASNLFPSEQALYEELVRRFTESFRSVALPALRDGHDEPATLRNYVRVNGEFVASNVKNRSSPG